PQSGDDVALPPDRRLAAQLAAPTWRLRGQGVLVESKDDVRKRRGAPPHGPDAGNLARDHRARALARARPRPIARGAAVTGGVARVRGWPAGGRGSKGTGIEPGSRRGKTGQGSPDGCSRRGFPAVPGRGTFCRSRPPAPRSSPIVGEDNGLPETKVTDRTLND